MLNIFSLVGGIDTCAQAVVFLCVYLLVILHNEVLLVNDIILYVLVSTCVISLGFDNKVINEGEKLHFTLRLNPNPPNPSSFYASPEPTLPRPTVTQSHSCLNLSLSLSLLSHNN